MKKMMTVLVLAALGWSVILSGCFTPVSKVNALRLGMTQEEVVENMGEPFAVRASKLYENEEWMEVWEYVPDIFSLAAYTEKYDKRYFLSFKNGKLVQWGEPGDFETETEVKEKSDFPALEYKGTIND